MVVTLLAFQVQDAPHTCTIILSAIMLLVLVVVIMSTLCVYVFKLDRLTRRMSSMFLWSCDFFSFLRSPFSSASSLSADWRHTRRSTTSLSRTAKRERKMDKLLSLSLSLSPSIPSILLSPSPCIHTYIPVLELVMSAILAVISEIFSRYSCSLSCAASLSDRESCVNRHTEKVCVR